MFWINILSFLAYWLVSFCFVFSLYYLKILPNDTKVRFSYNPLDFILDLLKVLSYDLQNYDPDTFADTGIIIYEDRKIELLKDLK